MTLTKELVEQFQQTHLTHFGELLNDEEAEQELKELAVLVRITSPKDKTRSNHATNIEGS